MSLELMTRGPRFRIKSGYGIDTSSATRADTGRRADETAAPTPGPDWTAAEQHEQEAALLPALNAERAKAGRPPLAANQHVQASISFYCQEMAEYEFMSHDSPDVGDPRYPPMSWWARIGLFGSPANVALGENLAYGFLDVPSVVEAWMSDEGHRDNVLQAAYTGVGCGCARDAKTGLLFWGNDFTSEAAGPPVPVAPQAGEHWRRKGLAKAALLLILPPKTATTTRFRNERTGLVGSRGTAAFMGEYERVS